jgi:hypothetical protein
MGMDVVEGQEYIDTSSLLPRFPAVFASKVKYLSIDRQAYGVRLRVNQHILLQYIQDMFADYHGFLKQTGGSTL